MCAYKLKIEAACELANRERVGETRALVWDPLDPAYFIWDPLQSTAGSYGTREKRKCPHGTRSFLSWSPMRRTAVLSSAAAAAVGHEF
jgi:hypothetical protein